MPFLAVVRVNKPSGSNTHGVKAEIKLCNPDWAKASSIQVRSCRVVQAKGQPYVSRHVLECFH